MFPHPIYLRGKVHAFSHVHVHRMTSVLLFRSASNSIMICDFERNFRMFRPNPSVVILKPALPSQTSLLFPTDSLRIAPISDLTLSLIACIWFAICSFQMHHIMHQQSYDAWTARCSLEKADREARKYEHLETRKRIYPCYGETATVSKQGHFRKILKYG